MPDNPVQANVQVVRAPQEPDGYTLVLHGDALGGPGNLAVFERLRSAAPFEPGANVVLTATAVGSDQPRFGPASSSPPVAIRCQVFRAPKEANGTYSLVVKGAQIGGSGQIVIQNLTQAAPFQVSQEIVLTVTQAS